MVCQVILPGDQHTTGVTSTSNNRVSNPR